MDIIFFSTLYNTLYCRRGKLYDTTTPVIVKIITEGMRQPTNKLLLAFAERACNYVQWKVPPVRINNKNDTVEFNNLVQLTLTYCTCTCMYS